MKALGPLAQSAVRELASQELGGGINICHICLASRAELDLASGDCAAQITDVGGGTAHLYRLRPDNGLDVALRDLAGCDFCL